MSVQSTKSRQKWRDKGYYVETTEHFVPPGHYADLFGFVDLVAVPLDGGPWVFVQSTSRSNTSTRLRKIQRESTGKGQWSTPMRKIARSILEAGHLILVEDWDQPGGAGTRWRDKERWVTLEDLEDG